MNDIEGSAFEPDQGDGRFGWYTGWVRWFECFCEWTF